MNKKPTTKPAPLKVTPLGQWKKRREQTKIVELPDGFVVKVRRLDIVDLAVTGYVPLALFSTLVETGAKLQDPKKLGTVDQDGLVEFSGVLRNVALKAVVEPRITETEEEDSISVDSLGVMNCLSIFSAAVDTSGAAVFRPFRK